VYLDGEPPFSITSIPFLVYRLRNHVTILRYLSGFMS
jgi:hypothetical protein